MEVQNQMKFLFVRLVHFLGIIFLDKKLKANYSQEYKNILLIRLDEIGDVVLMTPLLREMRSNYPEADITLIVKPQVYNLVELCPYVNKVMTFNRHEGRFSFIFNIIKAFRYAKVFLWKEKYDLVIVPRWDTDHYGASFLAFFSGGAKKLAYSEIVNESKRFLNKGYDGFFTDVFHTSDIKHEVLRNLDWIKVLGGDIQSDELELWCNSNDRKVAENLLSNKNKNDFLISVIVSAGNHNREWSSKNFQKLFEDLLDFNQNIKFLFLGDEKNTRKIKNEIVTEKLNGKIIDCIGKTTLRQTVALLRKSDFFIGLDTGPMHLAAACDLPGVVISCHPKTGVVSHGNAPERFGPWKAEIVVLQPQKGLEGCINGCKKSCAHCINQVTVDEVFKVCKRKLKDL